MRDHWAATGEGGPFPSGATVFDAATATAWVLVEHHDHRVLGQALAWALHRHAAGLHLLLDGGGDAAGIVARRATAFLTPVTVWRVDRRDVAAAAPAPLPPQVALPAGATAIADRLRACGTEPVVEHGVLTGEVLGLEVARLDPGDEVGGLEVGVGRHDREARHLLFPDQPAEAALAEAVAAVRRLRVEGAKPHPANSLATERWLRAVVIANPELVGAAALAAVAPPVPREDLRRPSAASAAGVDRAGEPLVVTCATATDLDAVPAAADAHLADGRPGCRLVLAMPPDDHRVASAMAADLREPASVVTVPEGWRRLSPVP